MDAETIAELRRFAEYRSLMLANLAHDLRTPLTAILGFAEILIEFERLTESQRALCDRIQNSGWELQNMIQVLSDLSRLDSDDSALVRREFPLPGTLRELESAFLRKLQKKKISLVWEVADDLISLNSDQSKLRQVLYNLLACAIARSPIEGNIRVAATASEGKGLLLRIEDEGEFLDCALGFDALSACVAGDNPTLQGVGLEISQRLVQVLGGAIKLESRKPRGLAIVLHLPI
ncbi:MAG: two-component system, NarL family, sensor histidine kinase BarA [Blastocatellia bacterium]|nr:two-component system, NarL family, sensor histidine kinase BarA [Blastocatellia bacterium]